MGPGPKKRKVEEKEPDSGTKRKMEEVEKSVTMEEINETLRTPKVLTGRVFVSRIFEKPSMMELVKYVRH